MGMSNSRKNSRVILLIGAAEYINTLHSSNPNAALIRFRINFYAIGYDQGDEYLSSPSLKIVTYDKFALLALSFAQLANALANPDD